MQSVALDCDWVLIAGHDVGWSRRGLVSFKCVISTTIFLSIGIWKFNWCIILAC